MTNVAVILVNWNGKANTLACLASLGKFKVIVVDNGSSDDSVAVVKKNYPDVEVLETGRNLGFAGGNNVGIRHALKQGVQSVWILNNDTVVDKNTLTALVNACRHYQAGIAGSKIYFASGSEFHKERYTKKDLGHVLWYAGGLIDWHNMYASHRGIDEVDHGQYDKAEETQFITGCSMLVRREVFEKIGFFDEKFFAYLEDVDFCIRASRAGYKLLFVPQSIVWHKNASSSGVGSDIHQYYMTRNRLRVGFRYAPLRTKLALMREALHTLVSGPAIRRKAIIDACI